MLKSTYKRNLRLPKYLIRRKVELVRRKIISRKFAYIWYRLAVSNILPTFAAKHYENTLKKNAFNKWRNQWFEKYKLWKLEIRADFHYKLTLKQKCIKQWLFFSIEERQLKLKEKIADKYYTRILKIRYYLRWKYASNAIKINNEYEELMQLHMIYLYLNFHISNCLKNYWGTIKKYLLNTLLQNNQETRLLKHCFKKFQIFTKQSIYRKNLNYKADCFFKFKYGRKLLENHLNLWEEYTLYRLEKKRKTEKALMHLNYVTKLRSFKKMHKYTVCRRLKNNIKRTIAVYFTEKLIKKCLKHWKVFVVRQQEKCLKIATADYYYKENLKRRCFIKIKAYRKYANDLRLKLNQYYEAKNLRLLYFCFKQFKKYADTSLLKKKQFVKAILFYENSLRKKCFTLLKNYVKRRKLKQLQLYEFFERGNKLSLQYCFRKWRSFVKIVSVKKMKIDIAETYYKFFLQKCYFKKLHNFLMYKQLQKHKELVAQRHFLQKLTVFAFLKWKDFLEEQKVFKTTLIKAKNFYRNNIEKAALRVILKAGILKEQEKEKIIFEQILRKYRNVYKYFKIWQNKLKKRNKTCEDKPKTFAIFETFQWNPICFEKPRIPEFLKHKV